MIEDCGLSMGTEAAVKFLEMYLPDNIPDEIKDDDFVAEYEKMLNCVRHLARRVVPIPPKVVKPVSARYMPFYSCGGCGHSVKTHEKWCSECGRQIKWKAIFPERSV